MKRVILILTLSILASVATTLLLNSRAVNAQDLTLRALWLDLEAKTSKADDFAFGVKPIGETEFTVGKQYGQEFAKVTTVGQDVVCFFQATPKDAGIKGIDTCYPMAALSFYMNESP